MQLETDIKMLKSILSVLENLCDELSQKYSQKYFECYYDSFDYKRVLKVTEVIISDGSIMVLGTDRYGVAHYYYSHAHFDMVDGWSET